MGCYSLVLTYEVYYWIQNRYGYYAIKYNKGEYSGDKYTQEGYNVTYKEYGLNRKAVDRLYDIASIN